jgi:hypothetical protein
MVLQTGNIEDGDLRNNVVMVGSVAGFAMESQGIGTTHRQRHNRFEAYYWHTLTALCNRDLCPDNGWDGAAMTPAPATTSSEPVGLLTVPDDASNGAMTVCDVAYSRFGEDLWLQDPPYIFEPPVPSPDILRESYEVRMRFTSWAHAWHQHVANLKREMNMPVLPPCSWCGTPTGDCCEACRGGRGAHAICTRCEATIRECRLCRLLRQIAAGQNMPPQVHQQKDSVWGGRNKCAACGVVGAGYKLCGSCLCFRFCSDACSKALWPEHKEVCQWLREPQPLMVINSSRMPIAEKIRCLGMGRLVPSIRVFDVSTSALESRIRTPVY